MTIFNKKKLAVAVTVTLLGSVTLTSAFASERVVQSQVESVRSNGVLVHVGKPVVSDPLKGFAKDLPLIAVLRQITPNGWVVKKNEKSGKTLDINKLVSWEGGDTWVNTLNKIAITNNLYISIDWNKKEVTIANVSVETVKTTTTTTTVDKAMPRMIPQGPKQSLFELEPENSTDLTKGASGQKAPEVIKTEKIEKTEKIVKVEKIEKIVPVVPVPVIPQPPKVESWQLKSGSSLKQNVIEMAKKSGYKVVWSGEDYPVDDDRMLVGNFDADNGPVMQLSEDYGPKSRVQQPLSFVFFQNNTLVVENYKFEQSGATQFVH